ncbi:MAG: carboxymuconolactone decarboxylase family protein [Dehalococcoidia bacterium]
MGRRVACTLTQRPALITLGRMARIPLRTSKDTSGEVSQLLRRLKERGTNLNVMRAIANSDGAFRNFLRLGQSLLAHCKLDPRWRELAIMRVAWRNGSDYEWGQHVSFARSAGLSDAEIEAVKDWEPSDLDERSKAVLRFTDEVDSVALTDETHAGVAAFLDTTEIAELTLSVGFWSMVARFLVGMQIEREPATPGFDGWQKESSPLPFTERQQR